MLKIKQLSKTFGAHTPSKKHVLHDITFEVPSGTIGVLLGASGAGKSTLLRIVAGLEKQDSGTVAADGTVGMVFQNFNLFENLTAQENIVFALTKGRTHVPDAQAVAIAHTLLQQYGLAELADKFPHELSGGQQQRLALARTIAQKPAVICFDEPTSALDPLLKTYVARTLTELAAAGYTLLVSTHDVQLVEQMACTIFLMHAGTITQTASSAEFRQNPENFLEIKRFMYHE